MSEYLAAFSGITITMVVLGIIVYFCFIKDNGYEEDD